MENPRNPFILGHRIKRPYFCDRLVEQERLMSAVINGRNVVLISPRRMGKTSLVHVSLYDDKTIEKEYQIFFFDILQTNSLNEFTYLIGKTIFDTISKNESRVRSFLSTLKSLKGSFGFDAFSGNPTFNVQLGDIKYPEYTLDEIFAYLEQSEKPVIVVIDEFQQITKYPEKNTEALLRSYMQRMTNATFIFSGSERTVLQEMFVSSKRPFYNSSEIMHLGPIDESVYVQFAKQLFEQYGKKLEEEAVDMAFKLFDGNTYYMQRVMNGAFAITSKGTLCDLDKVKRAIKEMLASNEVIYREILSNISSSKKALLVAVAKDRFVKEPLSGGFVKSHALVSASSVQSAISKLTKIGMLYNAENGYALTDPLLRIFINQLYSVAEF